jgi:biotin-dependent carboxylase-like uncharacterized protein
LKTFKVIKPGPLTTLQDGGRFGQNHLGVTEGGPMDFRSFALANRLVGNEMDASALEITLGGLELECLTASTICLTGAFSPLTINGQARALWQTHRVNKGDVVKAGFAALGVRCYLSVCGGFDEAQFFNSQATVVRENIGTVLQPGMDLHSSSCSLNMNQKLNYLLQPSLRKKATLDFVAGYQWDLIFEDSRQAFTTNNYVVSKENDRMGYRLEGEPIETGINRLYSEGIARGAIQITGEGFPIVLLKDRQTIGGYPKLGSVTFESLDVLAQLTQGAEIQFRQVSPEKSIQDYRQYMKNIESVEFEQ